MNQEYNTVLVVEDEKFFLKTICPKLKEANLKVIEAKDGQSGLKTALKHKPDLIILDVVMPNMDGFTVLKELRKDEWGKTVPVTMLSNLSDPLRITETEEDKYFVYLLKAKTTLEEIVTVATEILDRLKKGESGETIMANMREQHGR